MLTHVRARARARSATRSSCCTTSTSACSPIDAVQFAKDVEPFKLFFLEDALAPEDIDWFAHDAPAVRHAAGDGRAVRQPARVAAADRRTG